jgi:3-carboxy-cis,cis-muconate cycloisomerase
MPSSLFDSLLFRDQFGTPAMRAVFADEALVRRYLEVEAALARAQSRLGVIPAEAGAAITEAARALSLDWDKLKAKTDIVGYPIVPVVDQLSAACAGEAGRYVHWGATTQDVMDTATVLQVRDALALVEADLAALQDILAGLAVTHRDTAMAGRTHLQQALPVTFGYKAAIWLAGIDRHRERLAQLRPRVLVGQFAGAVGTLASLGDRGLEVQAAFLDEIGLARPAITWHVARDGLAEAVLFLGLVTGSLAKIATDVMLLMATEIGEVFEPFVKGRGGSSTMPQKRNPISCELILACAKGVRQQTGLMLDGMVQDLERATGPWHAEWLALPEAFLLGSSALAQARFMLGGLVVDGERMRRNLGLTGGLIVAEAAMMGLAVHTGRQQAHHLVYDACRAAVESGRPLLEVLAEMPEVTAHLDRAALERLLDPANYVGAAPEMVDRLLAGRS